MTSEDMDPIADEGRRILAEDPTLRDRLQQLIGRIDQGDIRPNELMSTDEVRQRFGLPLGTYEAAAG